MIQLDPSVVATFSHLAQPPTHAKLTHLVRSLRSMHGLEPTDVVGVFGKRRIEVVYEYGTVKGDEFVVNQHVPHVHAHIALHDRTKITKPRQQTINAKWPADVQAHAQKRNEDIETNWDIEQKKHLANTHLLTNGVVPHPEEPWTPVSVPSARAEHFYDQDIDAILCSPIIGDPRLKGRVAPHLPLATN